jgi:hypothetical protein
MVKVISSSFFNIGEYQNLNTKQDLTEIPLVVTDRMKKYLLHFKNPSSLKSQSVYSKSLRKNEQLHHV